MYISLWKWSCLWSSMVRALGGREPIRGFRGSRGRRFVNMYLCVFTHLLFEGVCFNSHHPGPRRAWKGGSELRLLTPDPRDTEDLRDPQMRSKSCKFSVFYSAWEPLTPGKLWRLCEALRVCVCVRACVCMCVCVCNVSLLFHTPLM